MCTRVCIYINKGICITHVLNTNDVPFISEFKAEAELPGACVQELSGDPHTHTHTLTALTQELRG